MTEERSGNDDAHYPAAMAYFVSMDAGYCTGAVLDVNEGDFMV
jgi:hypothetical protein